MREDLPHNQVSGAPQSLASTRFAINLGNLALARLDAASGELSGISVDLARELGRRLGQNIVFVRYPSAGAVMKGLDEQAWDVAFLAVDPTRTELLAYTRPYLSIQGLFATQCGSGIQNLPDVDQPGVKIASAAGAAYAAHLSRNLRNAELVMAAHARRGLEPFGLRCLRSGGRRT